MMNLTMIKIEMKTNNENIPIHIESVNAHEHFRALPHACNAVVG